MILAKGITIQHDALNVSYYATLMHGKLMDLAKYITNMYSHLSV